MSARNGDTLPPHDAIAEAGALACILSAEKPEGLLAQLAIDDFYEERHRKIFSTLEQLRRANRPLNVVELAQELRDRNGFEMAGGLEYVSTLPDQTPSVANFPSFLEVVRDRAIRRAALRDTAEVSTLARDTTIPATAIADAARRMADAYSRPPAELPPIFDAAQFTSESLTKPEELIAGILHRGSKLVLGGGSKSFKTWMLLDLALSVSHGQPWLSFQTTAGRVLYVNFEIQPWSWQHRLKATAAAREIEIKPGSLCLWNLRGKAADFSTLIPQIRQTVQKDFALIILDPIYKLYGQTDENKASDVARLLNSLEDLAVSTGAAVAFGAHFSKGNQAAKESIDRISGSGVFARDPDSLLVFTRHEEDDAFTVEATLRNFAPVEPFVVRWQFPLMLCDGGLDPARLKKAKGRTQQHTTDTLVDVLNGDSLTSGEWQKRANEETGMASSTFYELLKELRQSKRITLSVINRKWVKASA